MHRPVVIHLSQTNPKPEAFRRLLITGRQIDLAVGLPGSLSASYTFDISLRSLSPNWLAKGWYIDLDLPLTSNCLLSSSVAAPSGGGSGGGLGCWPGGSMPALKAGPPCWWCGFCWLLRCWSGGGCCICRPRSAAAPGVGGDDAHHGGGCISHAGGSDCAGLAAAGAGAGDVAGGGC